MTDKEYSKQQLAQLVADAEQHVRDAVLILGQAGVYLPDDDLEAGHTIASWGASLSTLEYQMSTYTIPDPEAEPTPLDILVDEAAQATEWFSEDELERYAASYHAAEYNDEELEVAFA